MTSMLELEECEFHRKTEYGVETNTSYTINMPFQFRKMNRIQKTPGKLG